MLYSFYSIIHRNVLHHFQAVYNVFTGTIWITNKSSKYKLLEYTGDKNRRNIYIVIGWLPSFPEFSYAIYSSSEKTKFLQIVRGCKLWTVLIS